MRFESLKPGMTVWDVGRHRMGNTTISTLSVWYVKILSVNPGDRTVMASWNGNAYKSYGEHQIKRWRLSKPVTIRGIMGSLRLATRSELAAMRAAGIHGGEEDE